MKKIWVFAFEYAGIAKFGGLGEVSANQCRSLATDSEIKLEVFLPSHGRHRRLQEKLNLQPLLESDGTKLKIQGHFDPSYFGMSYGDEIHARSFTKFQSYTDVTYFEVEIWHGMLDGVSVNLLVGSNVMAARILNDHEVYAASTLNAKLGLFSLVMKEYMRYCIFKEEALIPDIIHIHDHHPVAALLCCRQELNKVGKDIRTIITMHLLTWPSRHLEFFWKCGVNNEPMLVQIGAYRIWKTISEIFEMCKEGKSINPTLEIIGCAVADRVIAVSENFLNSDIIPNCGKDIIRFKSNFTWNGCDWDYELNKRKVWEKYKEYIPEKTLDNLERSDLRKLFLENVIGNLPDDEPRINSLELQMVISEEFKAPPYHKNGTVDCFDSDGPLILVTGRVSYQKGVEVIFYAIPHIIKLIPNVRFVFLMVPTPYSIEDLREYMVIARKYPKNIRFLFGIAGSIYLLAYLSADLYLCPSRWEPFGIVALEAMASRIPIVATYVGGLMESIIHFESDPENGTGLLVPNEDGDALKFAIVALLSSMIISEKKKEDDSLGLKDIKDLLKYIVHPKLYSEVKKDLLFGFKIRENAYRRITTTFRWKIVSQKLKKIYLDLNY